MNANGTDREDRLARLLAEYDDALAAEATPRLDSIDTDPAVDWTAEWQVAKDCLDLIDRARRRGYRPSIDGATAVPTDAGSRLGRFLIERELGRGGLGIVYLAFDPSLARQVAIKVPRADALENAELRRRFLREAEAAARLSHPHLVALHEVGQEQDLCFLAAEYCPGPTLARWLRAQSRVSFRQAASIVLKLAEAVQHAHSRGVLHRDIKPSNVLVNPRPAAMDIPFALDLGDAFPKLTDFGMAKLLESAEGETRTGAIIGTPAYMSPEQAEGRVDQLDARTDVYALGAILYELLTGAPPFVGKNDADMLRQLLLHEPIAPRQLRPDTPRDLQAIALKCLAKSPEQRYVTANELADDLRRFLLNQPTHARPLSTSGWLWKWARRRPAIAGLSAVLAMAIFTMFIGMLAYNTSLQHALTETNRQREAARDSSLRTRELLYAADMRLAQSAWRNQEVEPYFSTLRKYVPEPGDVDLRTSAWYYLRGLSEQQMLTCRGHVGAVFSVAASPDGKLWASAGEDSTVRLWDATDGTERGVLRGHTDEALCVTFSPDGLLLASAGEDHTVRLWRVSDGKAEAVLSGHTDHVMGLEFSPDGRLLASGGLDHSVRIWDPQSGQSLVRLEATGQITSVAFARGGAVLAAGDLDNGAVHSWQTTDWSPLPEWRYEGEGYEKITALASSPDGLALAGAGWGNRPYVFQVEPTGLRLRTVLDGGHEARIQGLAFAPGNRYLAAVDKEGVIMIWDTGKIGHRRDIVGHPSRVWDVSWSPDGHRLASAGADGTLRVWDLDRAMESAAPYAELPRRSRNIVFSPDGRSLVANSDESGISWYDVAQRQLLKTNERVVSSFVDALFSPDGLLLAISTHVGQIWVSPDGDPQGAVCIAGEGNGHRPVSWSSDGQHLATCDKNDVIVVDAKTGQIVRRIHGSTRVRSLAFSPDGRQLAVSHDQLVLYSWPSMQVLATWDRAEQLQYSQDSRILLAVSQGQALLYDAANLRLLKSLDNYTDTACLALAPDGETLAVHLPGTRNRQIFLWDIRSGQQVAILEAPGTELYEFQFSPQGDRLVCVGKDKDKYRVWEWSIRRDRE